jgi:D-inositol-3-phosphate glycosyltransferase
MNEIKVSETRRADVTIVGPTHPHVGGIAQHTTRLGHELARLDLAVRVESWRNAYPKWSRNGLGMVPRDAPEIPPLSDVTEKLNWYSPLSWIALSRRLRADKLVLFTVVAPPHAIMFALAALSKPRPLRGAIVHNVLPHERGVLDRFLVRWFLRRMSFIIVHTEEQERVAKSLGVTGESLHVLALPSPRITSAKTDVADPPYLHGGRTLHLLFFGMVRHYKGLDILLNAMAECADVSLTVAGHFWEPIEKYRSLIDQHKLQDRVNLMPGYVDAADIPGLMAQADVLVMPYRTATASIVADIAFEYGRPVFVTDVGNLAESVNATGAGVVAKPENIESFVHSLIKIADRKAYEEMVLAAKQVQAKPDERWARYVRAIAERAREQ